MRCSRAPGAGRSPCLLLRRPGLLLLLAVLLAALPPQGGRAQSIASLALRLRIGVTADGIAVVSPSDLSLAGVDPLSIDPRTFAMSSMGAPVAIHVTGEADGRFDTGDRIYFFGQRFRGSEMEQKYTSERVYWLDTGGAPGPRIASVLAAPKGDLTPPQHFPTTVRAEESVERWSRETLYVDTQDTWFWARLTPLSSVVTGTLPYAIPDPAPGEPGVFRLEEISRAGNVYVNPDHRTVVTLNGVQLLDQTWDGAKTRKVFTATVPAGLLAHGTNNVNVGAWKVAGVAGDDVYVNYWEIDYRRQFRAYQGRLDFRAEGTGPHEYEAGGWSTGDVLVWDVTDANQPRMLVYRALGRKQYLPLVARDGSAAATSPALAREADAAQSVSVRFRVQDAPGMRFWMQESAAVQPPASVRLRQPTGLRSPAGGADAVIVTSPVLRPAAERLADWHRAHGRRALVADLGDVVDEFNHGIYHPKAVPAMLAWARAHWAAPGPAFLTLVGDGHWNLMGYNPTRYSTQPVHIPPFLAFVDPWLGEASADALYGDLEGDDGVPEVAVGRIAVNDLAGAHSVVDKIVGYDETVRSAPWQKRALFVADNAEPGSDFPWVSDQIIAGDTPSDLEIVRAYVPNGDPVDPAAAAQVRATIFSTIQDGAWMVQYTGHGSLSGWAHSIWHTSDVAALSNAPRLPFVMTFNCQDGDFSSAVLGAVGLAETMQRKAGGGAVASISPSGEGTTNDQLNFRTVLLHVMFTDGVREIGEALKIAKQQYAQIYGVDYMVATMTLYGDPALRLPVQAP